MINPFASRPSGASLLAMVFGAILAAVLYFFSERWGLSPLLRSLIWALGMALLFAVMAIYRNSRRPPPARSPVSKKETHSAADGETQSPYTEELCDYLRHRYGRFWRSKVRLVVLVGQSRLVGMIAPELISQQWIEADGTVLLWGGNITSASDSNRIAALRKLRRRPPQAIVWVCDARHQQVSLADTAARQLRDRAKLLGWQVPLYVWQIENSESPPASRETQPIGCLLPANSTPQMLEEALRELTSQLTVQGTQQVLQKPADDFMLRLSHQLLNGEIARLRATLAPLLSGPYAAPLRGIMFSQPLRFVEGVDKFRWLPDASWKGILNDLSSVRAKRIGIPWAKGLRYSLAGLLIFWCFAAVLSFTANRAVLRESVDLTVRISDPAIPLEKRLMNLQELQRKIGQLQYRAVHGAPWYLRFGMNQNEALLAALWPHYLKINNTFIRDAAASKLTQQMNALLSLPPDSPQRGLMARQAYDQLKAYLMMARPEKMDAQYFTTTMMKQWPQRNGVSDAVWRNYGPSLLSFYAQNLSAHPQWKITQDEAMVGQVRTLLLRQIGMRNAEASLYQKMLLQVARHYADMHLEDMVGDTSARPLFSTDSVVPGMFTRKAWEEAVQPAIDDVVNTRRDEIDWVLNDNKHPVKEDISPQALKARLTERYFADFSGAWLGFLNSIHWRRADTLSDAIDQLTLLADIRQSPLVALLNTLDYQGKTGRQNEALTESLVKSAQNLIHADQKPAIDQRDKNTKGPLDDTFTPLLTLMNSNAGGDGYNSLSLQSFLTRITRVRLRLQQVTNTADPQAMTQALAQTVFQGKSVDVTDTRDYGSLVAASLGQEWSGFGQAMFVQPMEQAWQQVLTPTAESINAQWRNAIVQDWSADFNGRYPFAPVQSEVSLALMSQYLRNDTGRIARFITTNLNGVIKRQGRHWEPDVISAQGLHFDPEFLQALNQLSELADVVFTHGDASLHFELMAKPAKDVMQTELTLDQQNLKYFNQMESWQPFNWPDSQWKPRVTLSWVSVRAGTRLYADYPGIWGFIRLLEKAKVTQIDSSTFRLVWKAPDGLPLNYLMRTEAGEGPLALLALKGFKMPQSIFLPPPATANDAGDNQSGSDTPD
ncbi:putative membrane protein [Rahnella aquatilis CIP 78.65 = ATCC 33071]|uniref:Type VI secretion protein VasK n=1 Tax=Rahnella aquatilis (strain ATCC 33071 / DSM 4594 / JCM 1683 / NBRC 105701 / NCIMB 13365 / CIP 78.65) TaxID=745277 RepID=H2ITP7_RAHAC|nr:ImcF-related family protein [Rahnella aquatilis]AEX50499.1 hypothetical protein Rahaq2_0572 [Rahnella aquatilis CIP 78.65 = ATCC 33071]KFD01480.1 putative membrane protein [Rahnella aquatilis CIP 78.65 = ATCC 33071]